MATDPHSPETAATPAKKRSAVANTFIVVGFLLLIFLGIAVAIYSSRYVPVAVNTFSSSNPVTGLPNNSTQQPTQVAVGTSIPFSNSQTVATTTVMTSSSGVGEPQTTNIQSTSGTYTTTPFPTTGSMYASLPNGYQATAVAYPATAPRSSNSGSYSGSYNAAPYGLPDLDVNIISVGYLANSSNASFVAAPVIPVDSIAAIEFSIGNVGTAPTGPWTFMAQIPTDNGYLFNSPIEPSLNPGDHTVFTLAFNQVPPGPAEMIEVIADPNNLIQELTKTNNTAGASVSVVGS